MARPGASFQQTLESKRKDGIMTEWLPTLRTETPQEGYDLAVKLARVAVKATQPDAGCATGSGPTMPKTPMP